MKYHYMDIPQLIYLSFEMHLSCLIMNKNDINAAWSIYVDTQFLTQKDKYRRAWSWIVWQKDA